METLEILYPDDWHCHLREGDFLPLTVSHISHSFRRAIVMPNLKPPITTVSQAKHYHQAIRAHLPPHSLFTPLMTLYLTEETTAQTIQEAQKSGILYAAKYYPKGVTTHAERGIQEIHKLYPLFETMQEYRFPLLIHGEIADKEIDIFDREKVFLEQILSPLVKMFPHLPIVLEHITTQEAVAFISEQPNTAATITPHHLLLNRNALFEKGLRPHHYCLPILKRKHHQTALIQAATSGNPKFFLGTDSAPHAYNQKESACGCAGIYNAPVALALCAEIFEKAQALHRLEGFTSRFGAQFYQVPLNSDTLRLVKTPWQVPLTFSVATTYIVPLCAGETLTWQPHSLGSFLS